MNILGIDFNALYKEQKSITTFKPKTKDDWNAKAKDMDSRIHQSIYNEEFLARVDAKECSTLLDVGCGPGNLALRFARKFEKVYAMDYSDEMLRLLNQNAASKKIENIETIQASWDDNWKELPNADIVVASRSMEVSDMAQALTKLDEKANKRVYLTYKVGGSFVDTEVLEAMGRRINAKPDFIYIVNILYKMGINPKVDYIESENKKINFSDFEAFRESTFWSIGEMSDDEVAGLRRLFEDENFRKKPQKPTYWAMISWEK
ncbi:MAG TPA: class I SAM-dependent methyltransferase [Campylobacterales bacterium]|nr:class I SAM-dependent methyltransferase [Campylobacterales bacterium]